MQLLVFYKISLYCAKGDNKQDNISNKTWGDFSPLNCKALKLALCVCLFF